MTVYYTIFGDRDVYEGIKQAKGIISTRGKFCNLITVYILESFEQAPGLLPTRFRVYFWTMTKEFMEKHIDEIYNSFREKKLQGVRELIERSYEDREAETDSIYIGYLRKKRTEVQLFIYTPDFVYDGKSFYLLKIVFTLPVMTGRQIMTAKKTKRIDIVRLLDIDWISLKFRKSEKYDYDMLMFDYDSLSRVGVEKIRDLCKFDSFKDVIMKLPKQTEFRTLVEYE